MKLNEAVKYAYEIAEEKGWHDQPRSELEVHALIHSEVAEATEAIREGKNIAHQLKKEEREAGFYDFVLHDIEDFEPVEGLKPEGHPIELVDAVIRIFDWFGEKGIDFEKLFKAKCEYNKTRPYRHGKKI